MRAGGIFGSVALWEMFAAGQGHLELTTRANCRSAWGVRVQPQFGSWPIGRIGHSEIAVWVHHAGTRRQTGQHPIRPPGTVPASGPRSQGPAPAGVDPLATRLLSLHLSLEGDGVAAGAEGPRPRLAAGVARWGGGHGIALSA
jgi:hypothetical protein